MTWLRWVATSGVRFRAVGGPNWNTRLAGLPFVGLVDQRGELSQELEQIGVRELPLTARHIAALEGMPWIHKDPFDRLLIATAIGSGLQLATTDGEIPKYPGVSVLSV